MVLMIEKFTLPTFVGTVRAVVSPTTALYARPKAS